MFFAIVLFGFGQSVTAQITARATSDAMARLRQGNGSPAIVNLLRQVKGPSPSVQIDALADSVQNFLLYTRSRESYAARAEGIAALKNAGKQSPRGTTYAGAQQRLLKIAQEAPSNADRAAAIDALGGLSDKRRSVEMLRGIAVSSSDEAYLAIRVLGGELADAGGAQVVLEIWRGHLEKQDSATLELTDMARRFKWPSRK